MQVNTVMVLSQPAPSARHYTNDRLLVRVKRVGTVLPGEVYHPTLRSEFELGMRVRLGVMFTQFLPRDMLCISAA